MRQRSRRPQVGDSDPDVFAEGRDRPKKRLGNAGERHDASSPVRRGAIAVAVATLAFWLSLRLHTEVSVWASTATAAVAAAAVAAATWWRRLVVLLRRDSWRWMLVGLAVGVFMALATHLVYPLAAALLPPIESEVERLYRQLQAPPGRLAAIPILVAVVVVEELVWRGILVDVLRPRLRAPAVIIAASLLYALPQIGSASWLLIFVSVGCGAIWTSLRLWSGGLRAPLACHLTWDALVFVAFPLGGALV